MSNAIGKLAPLTVFATHTPHDTNEIHPLPRAIMIESDGPMRIRGQDGVVVTLAAVLGGVWHPMSPREIHDTGTTATTVYLGY